MASAIKESNQLNQMYGVGALGGDYNKLYQMLLSSPYFQNLLSNASIQGNNFSQNLTSNLAQRGLTGTGVGAISQSMGSSMPGFMQQTARANLSQEAMQAAMQNLMARMGIYGQMRQQEMNKPNFLQSLFGGLAGGVGSILPLLGRKDQTTQVGQFQGMAPQ